MKIKKIISIFLALMMVFTVNANVLAAGRSQDKIEAQSLQAEVEQLKATIPEAEIRVENNIIHVVIDDVSKIPGFESSSVNSSKTTSINASNGGSYRYFTVPSWDTFGPYSQVYIPAEKVDSLIVYLTKPTIVKFIMNQIAVGIPTAAIPAMVLAAYGVSIPAGVVTFISGFLYWTGTNLEYWSLENARKMSTTGKISVVRGLSRDGHRLFIYSPWNNNTCNTYNGYNATWFGGTLDLG